MATPAPSSACRCCAALPRRPQLRRRAVPPPAEAGPPPPQASPSAALPEAAPSPREPAVARRRTQDATPPEAAPTRPSPSTPPSATATARAAASARGGRRATPPPAPGLCPAAPSGDSEAEGAGEWPWGDGARRWQRRDGGSRRVALGRRRQGVLPSDAEDGRSGLINRFYSYNLQRLLLRTIFLGQFFPIHFFSFLCSDIKAPVWGVRSLQADSTCVRVCFCLASAPCVRVERERGRPNEVSHGEGPRDGAAHAVPGPRHPAHGALPPPRRPRLRGHLRQHRGGPRARARRAGRRRAAARHPPRLHPGRAGRRRGPERPQQARRRLLPPHARVPGGARRGDGGGRAAQGEVARRRRQHGVVLPGRQEARHPCRLLLAGVHGLPRHHAQDPQAHPGRRPQRQGVAGEGGDAAAGPRDAPAAHLPALLEQRRRPRRAARHLRPGVPEQQVQRPGRDSGDQLVPGGGGGGLQALPGHPAHRPALRRRRVPETRGQLPPGGRAVPEVAGRAGRRLRRVRGLRQHGHLRPAPVPGAGRGAGAHRPALPVGRAPRLHPRPGHGVAPGIPAPRRRHRHDRQLVLPATGPGAPRRGVLRVALRLELDAGGGPERRAGAVLALLLRPVPGPELRHRRVEDRTCGGARRGRRRGQGGGEGQGGQGHRRRRVQEEGRVAQGRRGGVRRRRRLVLQEFHQIRGTSKRVSKLQAPIGRAVCTISLLSVCVVV